MKRSQTHILCSNCGGRFVPHRKNKRYCSSSCARIYNNRLARSVPENMQNSERSREKRRANERLVYVDAPRTYPGSHGGFRTDCETRRVALLLSEGARLRRADWAVFSGTAHPVVAAARLGVDPVLVSMAALPSSAPPQIKTRLRPFVEALEAGGSERLSRQAETIREAGAPPRPARGWLAGLMPVIEEMVGCLDTSGRVQIRAMSHAVRAGRDIEPGSAMEGLCGCADRAVAARDPEAAMVFAAGAIGMSREYFPMMQS